MISHIHSSRIQTLTDLFLEASDRFANKTAIVNQEGTSLSYGEFGQQCLQVMSALHKRGVKRGDRIALLIENIPQFLVSNIGALYSGGTSVLMHPEVKPHKALQERFDFIQPRIILTLEKRVKKVQEYNQNYIPILSLEEALMEKPTSSPVHVEPEDHAVYIFSSGTTGINQGSVVMLTHKNLVSNILATDKLLKVLDGGVYLTGVADNTHSFEHFIQLWILHNGMQLHYTNLTGFMKGSAAMVKPHYLIMIPKVANTIMHSIKKRFQEMGLLMLLEKSVEQSTSYYRSVLHGKKADLRARFIHKIADRTIYALVRKGLKKNFGNRLKWMVGGSAPLPAKTQEFFLSVGRPQFDIKQGYGLTETSPVICVNVPEHYRIDPGNWGVGSSGRVIPGVEVLVVDPQILEKEGRISPLQDEEEGLLLVKGPNVFAGYYKNPQKTASVFIDGWFNTEDYARKQDVVDNSGLGPYLYITGRQKNLIVFENGTKFAPEIMEMSYEAEQCDVISKLVCIGGDKKPYLSAIVIPQEGVRSLILENPAKESEVTAGVLSSLSSSASRFGFAIRKIALDLHYDPAYFETSSKKLKRKLYLQERKELIDRLYATDKP